jgi:hypothetical protein
MKKLLASMCLCLGSFSVWAGEIAAPADPDAASARAGVSSHGLMAQLQGFLRQQGVDENRLSADAMVRVMVDWYRFSSDSKAQGAASTGDALVYRYGGWSEGCATAFKLSLLRKVTVHHANEADTERFAGITLMFEPSGQADLMPFSAVSSDARSIEAFVQTIESSPAFRELAGVTPMGVLVEGGGLR